MDCIGSMDNCLPQGFRIIAAKTLQISVGHDRSRVVAYHAAAMAGAGPLWQEAALLVGVDETFLHLGVL